MSSPKKYYFAPIFLLCIINIVNTYQTLELDLVNDQCDGCSCNFEIHQMKCKLEDLPVSNIPKGITNIIITDEQLRCDCQIANIIRWAKGNKIDVEAKCASPQRYKGRKLSKINLSDFMSSCNKELRIPMSAQLRPISANHNVDYILLFNGTMWLPVCNYNWEDAESMVTCRQLGYIGSKESESQYDMENEMRKTGWRMDGNCTGLESQLSDCDIQINDIVNDCSMTTLTCLNDQGGNPLNCDFKKGLCSWSEVSDGLSWIWSKSNDNYQGYQVLVQLINRAKLQSTTSLQSPMLKPINKEIEVNFMYYLRNINDAQLSLQIKLENDNNYVTLYSLNTEEMEWSNGTVIIGLDQDNFQLRFKVQGGKNAGGEIGIGYIQVTGCKLAGEERKYGNRFVVILIVICVVTVLPPLIFIYAYVVKKRSPNEELEMQINIPCTINWQQISTLYYGCCQRSRRSNAFEVLQETTESCEAPAQDVAAAEPARPESPPIFPPDFQEPNYDNTHIPDDAPPPYYYQTTPEDDGATNIQLCLITLGIANHERSLLPSYDSVVGSENSRNV